MSLSTITTTVVTSLILTISSNTASIIGDPSGPANYPVQSRSLDTKLPIVPSSTQPISTTSLTSFSAGSTCTSTTASIFARPLPSGDSSSIPSGAVTCELSRDVGNGSKEYQSYEISIGSPWNASQCAKVYDTLKNHINKYNQFEGLWGFQCTSLDPLYKATHLEFTTGLVDTPNTNIVEGLAAAYPDLPFREQRWCLLPGVAAPANWSK